MYNARIKCPKVDFSIWGKFEDDYFLFFRHWVSKHAQDFENDPHLKNLTIEFLDDIIYSPNLLPAEHKAAAQLLRLIRKEEPEHAKIDLDRLLAPPMVNNRRFSRSFQSQIKFCFDSGIIFSI